MARAALRKLSDEQIKDHLRDWTLRHHSAPRVSRCLDPCAI